jgi:hypothetical protein
MTNIFGDRGSALGITTRYGLDGQGFEPVSARSSLSAPHPSRPALGPATPPLRLRRPECGFDHELSADDTNECSYTFATPLCLLCYVAA